ncbi:MAG: LacI family DNA-binding transcriptional regulator [Burkholderiaceae bacterium]
MKNITIKDIAARLGISHPTVSRALRDHPAIRKETRELVKKTARELGYIPHSGARMLRRTRSELIGVIFPDVQNDFYSKTMSTLATAFLHHGYKLVLAGSEDRPSVELEQIRSLREARVAGVIIAPTAGLRKEAVALLDGIPTVQLLRRHATLPAPVVSLDERAGIAAAVHHLAGKSHRRIGFIGSPNTLSTGKGRAQGYRQAMREAALRLDESWLFQGPPRPEFGRASMLALLSGDNPPTAVILASPELALGGLLAIRELGIRVPEQLALIAYHDPDWFQLWGPGISCIRLPVHDMASAAVSLLLAQMGQQRDGKAAAAAGPETCFMPILVERGTT